MPSLVLLAALAWGQDLQSASQSRWLNVINDFNGWPVEQVVCDCCKGPACCAMVCYRLVPLPTPDHSKVIDWLKPFPLVWLSNDVYIRLIADADGTPRAIWITTAEIERWAKEK